MSFNNNLSKIVQKNIHYRFSRKFNHSHAKTALFPVCVNEVNKTDNHSFCSPTRKHQKCAGKTITDGRGKYNFDCLYLFFMEEAPN